MQILKGIAVSPGVAICPALVLDSEDQPVPRRTVSQDEVQQQLTRLEEAIDQSRQEVDTLRKEAAESLGEELAAIFGFHVGMLADAHLVEQMRETIQSDHVTADYAVYTCMRRMGQTFLQSESKLLRERVSDVWDLERRLLRHLSDRKQQTDLALLEDEVLVVAHDLTPSQTASMNREKVLGIATDAGGRTSHTAILAHALGIPAVVGVEGLTAAAEDGKTIIVDGDSGQVIIDPDAEKLLEYRQEAARMAKIADTLVEVRELPAVTRDGTDIRLYANIEFPDEIDEALRSGATGVGLYRTEFLFLASEREPTEDEQYEAYVDAIRRLDGKPLTIRTLDLGADKITRSMSASGEYQERNPFLGCRSIRLCLQNLPLFKTQLRAILRASAEGPVRLMFPLISNIMELRQARMILNDVMEDLEDQGVAFRSDMPVGMMIEVPSVAIQATTFTREVDFFSVGTNDLIQYTVAVDRSNERIANLYSAAHPAVITMLKDVIRSAGRAKIGVGLCGEMASQPVYTMLLLGFGLRSFSITPPAIAEVKRVVRAVSLDQCKRVARKVMQFESDRQVLGYLREEVAKVMPDVYGGRSIAY